MMFEIVPYFSIRFTTMAFITSTVCTLLIPFDCNLPISLIAIFGSTFNYRCGKSSMPVSVVTTGLFSYLEKLVPESVLSVDTAYDVKLGLITAPLQSLMLKYCSLMILVSFSHHLQLLLCVLVMQPDAGVFIWSETCVQQPLIMCSNYASLFWIERSGDIRHLLDFVLPCSFSAVLSRQTGEFSYHGLVLILSLFTESMYPHCGSVDHEMSDASDLPCTSDSDVAGPGATLNNDSMNIDIQGGTDTEKRAPGLIFFFHQICTD